MRGHTLPDSQEEPSVGGDAQMQAGGASLRLGSLGFAAARVARVQERRRMPIEMRRRYSTLRRWMRQGASKSHNFN